jgi:hypothetical protein
VADGSVCIAIATTATIMANFPTTIMDASHVPTSCCPPRMPSPLLMAPPLPMSPCRPMIGAPPRGRCSSLAPAPGGS